MNREWLVGSLLVPFASGSSGQSIEWSLAEEVYETESIESLIWDRVISGAYQLDNIKWRPRNYLPDYLRLSAMIWQIEEERLSLSFLLSLLLSLVSSGQKAIAKLPTSVKVEPFDYRSG